jgi:phosphohistidine phosphatase
MVLRHTMPREDRPTPMFMRQLLLLRHAKSSWDDRSVPDRDRGLAPRGQYAAAAMGQAMRRLGLAPDLILVSPARRTRETLEALEPWDEAPLIEPIEILYLATAIQLVDALRGVPETVRSVMVVGHNPGMHELAVLLGGNATAPAAALAQVRAGYPTGALAEFNVPGAWSRLGAGGGQLVRFLRPRDLEQDGSETASER